MAATTASVVYSTQITHVGSGTSLAAAAMMPSSDTSTALSSTNLGRYPLADIALMFKHTASLSSASNTINLYRRDLNVDGTGDENIPLVDTTNYYKAKLAGVFVAKAAASNSDSITQYCQVTDVTLSDQCEFYIENSTNASILAGWTLKVTPKSYAGA